MDVLYFAFILIFSYNGDQYYGYGSTNPNLKGLESRYEIALGPQGPTKAECDANADKYRKWYAADKKLNTYTRIKFDCIALPVATK
jgi:hypothetical protein